MGQPPPPSSPTTSPPRPPRLLITPPPPFPPPPSHPTPARPAHTHGTATLQGPFIRATAVSWQLTTGRQLLRVRTVANPSLRDSLSCAYWHNHSEIFVETRVVIRCFMDPSLTLVLAKRLCIQLGECVIKYLNGAVIRRGAVCTVLHPGLRNVLWQPSISNCPLIRHIPADGISFQGCKWAAFRQND